MPVQTRTLRPSIARNGAKVRKSGNVLTSITAYHSNSAVGPYLFKLRSLKMQSIQLHSWPSSSS